MAEGQIPKLKPIDITRDEMELFSFWNRGLYVHGKIEEDVFRGITNALTAVDSQGNIWTMGAQSGKWYKKKDGKWIEGRPEERLLIGVPEERFNRFIMGLKKIREEAAVREKAWEEGGKMTQVPSLQTEKPAKALYCNGCGAELVEDSKFCMMCGKPVM